VEDAMPAVDVKAIFLTTSRPLVAAVAHVPIVLVVLFTLPLWVMLAFKPVALEGLATRILMELRRWSAASIGVQTGGGE
jgi:hypothetical protein